MAVVSLTEGADMDCLFCKIVAGEIPAEVIYESDTAVAFRDINPQAPTHVLVKEIAASEGIAEHGYRAVMNCNEAAGQTVFHIHLHVLGGRSMGWPPF
jgi:histidine triad (HIT) family protein